MSWSAAGGTALATAAVTMPGDRSPERDTDARLAAIEAELITGLNGAAEVVAVQRVPARNGELVEWPTLGASQIDRLDGEVALRVMNQGHTIAAEHLPHLFNRFYRADAARSDAARNHGLGLAIVAAIARMHGGRVAADSRGGITSIGLDLPAAAAAAG